MTYSWILPVRNEQNSLHQLLDEITFVMRGKKYEIIAVDDASLDNSYHILTQLQKKDRHLKVIRSREWSGKWESLRKGFALAKGDLIVTLDSDLQDDPGGFSKLESKINQGYDVVSGWRKTRYDPLYKVILSGLGNKMVRYLQLGIFHDLNSPFKIYRKEVLKHIPTEGTFLRYSLLFAQKFGYKVAEVPVQHRPRQFGQSKFGPRKYFRIIYDLILIKLLFSGSGRIRPIP